jgi:hypothetical protein
MGDTSINKESIDSLMQMAELLKPVNSVITFYNPNYIYNNVTYGTSTNNIVLFPSNVPPRPGDIYAQVTGIGIPDNTYITSINTFSNVNGVSATIALSNNVTASGTSLTVIPKNKEISLTNKQIVSDSDWFEFDMYAASNQPINSNNQQLNQYSKRYWLSSSTPSLAPLFAHMTTIEENISLNNLVSNVSVVSYSSYNSAPNSGSSTINNSNILTNASTNIGATVYGAQ